MKSSSNSIGIVLDEYGVSVGLISMEDLIEEIIGDIKDEYDDAEHNNIVKIDDTHYSIDGGIKLDDLNDALDLDIESEDYDSIGGYIIQLLDHLPAVGDTASDGVISCKVTKLDKKRVSRVLLKSCHSQIPTMMTTTNNKVLPYITFTCTKMPVSCRYTDTNIILNL